MNLFETINSLDSFVLEDIYDDLYKSDGVYIYHGDEDPNILNNGISSSKAYFSDSKYDAEGYGPYIVRVRKDKLSILEINPSDSIDENIPNGYDGIKYTFGPNRPYNYIIYSSSVNDILE